MSGFQTKQFYVDHQGCGMKVSTDSLILGSWADPSRGRRLLDVGTGSGLLALMMAQRADQSAHIDAIDVDKAACQQAARNAKNSPWPNRVHVHQCPLQQWQPTKGYDVIIANPPYFPAGQVFQAPRQRARHQGQLDFSALVQGISTLLNGDGDAYLIVPAVRFDALYQQANFFGMKLVKQLCIRHNALKPVSLVASRWRWHGDLSRVETLTIRHPDQRYTSAYRQLCRDYYWHF